MHGSSVKYFINDIYLLSLSYLFVACYFILFIIFIARFGPAGARTFFSKSHLNPR